MSDIINSIFTAPLATIFVVAGMIFLFVAVAGNISGKVEPGAKGRVMSGILGLVFVITGITMYLQQTLTTPKAQSEQDAIKKPTAIEAETGRRGATSASQPPMAASTREMQTTS